MSQLAYRPSTVPPQALNCQSTPRTTPWPLTTKVGPTSRAQASSESMGSSRILSESISRAVSIKSSRTSIYTSSLSAMASATAAKALRAAAAP